MVHDGLLDKSASQQRMMLQKKKVGNGTALFTCAQYGVTIDATKQSGLYDSIMQCVTHGLNALNFSDGSAQVQVESEGRSGSPAIIFYHLHQHRCCYDMAGLCKQQRRHKADLLRLRRRYLRAECRWTASG